MPCCVCIFAVVNFACQAMSPVRPYRSTCGCCRLWASHCGLPAMHHRVAAGSASGGCQARITSTMQALPTRLQQGLPARCRALQPKVFLPFPCSISPAGASRVLLLCCPGCSCCPALLAMLAFRHAQAAAVQCCTAAGSSLASAWLICWAGAP